MSQNPPSSSSSSRFQSIFDNALEQYKKKTKNDLIAHRLTAQLQTCDSPGAIIAVLDEKYHLAQFIQSQSDDSKSKQFLNATVNVLYAFSSVIGQGVGLVNLFYC
jgi:fungal STAND N-terminal Goodbye domain